MSDIELLVVADKKQSKNKSANTGRFVKTKKDEIIRDNMPVNQSYIDVYNEGFGLSGFYLEIDKSETEKYQKAAKAKIEKAKKKQG
jgi:hypothetical protein